MDDDTAEAEGADRRKVNIGPHEATNLAESRFCPELNC
jgi:hypothetical protein